jgi:hypothetical protein
MVTALPMIMNITNLKTKSDEYKRLNPPLRMLKCIRQSIKSVNAISEKPSPKMIISGDCWYKGLKRLEII